MPVAHWFLATATVAGLTFVAGVVIVMTMTARTAELNPQPEVAAQIERLTVALIVVFALLLACGAGLAVIVRYAVLKPIGQLTEQVRTVAAWRLRPRPARRQAP